MQYHPRMLDQLVFARPKQMSLARQKVQPAKLIPERTKPRVTEPVQPQTDYDYMGSLSEAIREQLIREHDVTAYSYPNDCGVSNTTSGTWIEKA